MSVLKRLISSLFSPVPCPCSDWSPPAATRLAPPDSITASPAAAGLHRHLASRCRTHLADRRARSSTAPDGQPSNGAASPHSGSSTTLPTGRKTRPRSFWRGRRAQRLTVVRVLTMMGGQFDLAARGRPARVAARARAGSEARAPRRGRRACRHCRHPVDLEEHVDAIGGDPGGASERRSGDRQRAVHPSQSPEVQQAGRARGLGRARPVGRSGRARIDRARRRLWRWRAMSRGTRRGTSGRAAGGTCSRWREGAELLRQVEEAGRQRRAHWRRAPSLQPGRRDDVPARFRAAALLTRLVGTWRDVSLRGRSAGEHSGRPRARVLQCVE